MSCVSCETFAKRITNIYRDEELKHKYAELTGCKILQDSFICDFCNEKLEAAHSFKLQCVEVYRKLNPNSSENIQSDFKATDPCDQTQRSEIFILDNDTLIGEDEHSLLATVKVNDEQEEYEINYLEFEEELEEELGEQSVDEAETTKVLDQSTSLNPVKNVLNRNSYTVEMKLKIIQYAEEHNNRMAARFFNMNESTVRCFRRHKEVLLNMSPQKKTNRKAFPHWPKLETELKDFVINHPAKHGTKAKLKEIKKEAISIAAKHGIENFNGSNSYIFKFMQRHSLPSASPRPRKHQITIKKE